MQALNRSSNGVRFKIDEARSTANGAYEYSRIYPPFFEDPGGDFMMNAATKQRQSSELSFPLDSTLTGKSLPMRTQKGKDIII